MKSRVDMILDGWWGMGKGTYDGRDNEKGRKKRKQSGGSKRVLMFGA